MMIKKYHKIYHDPVDTEVCTTTYIFSQDTHVENEFKSR